jgi:hypothetical protein
MPAVRVFLDILDGLRNVPVHELRHDVAVNSEGGLNARQGRRP